MRVTRSCSLPWWGITITCLFTSARAFSAAELEPQAAPNPTIPLLTNLLQLQDFAHADASRICSFRLNGTVCAVDRSHSTLAFQDPSTAEVLHVVLPPVPLEPGNKIVLEGTNFAVTATENG